MTSGRGRLWRLALPGGGVVGLAIDHRDSLRQAASRRGWDAEDRDLTDLKRRLLDGLADEASMVLLDDELGGGLLREGAVPDGVGLAMPLEAQGYETVGDGRITQLLAGFGPGEAAQLGADACKLLLPVRPDHEASATPQLEVAREATERCHAEDLPLVAEPIVYQLPGEDDAAYRRAFGGLVLESARRLTELGIDLLKVQYPGSGAACRELHAACGGTPWVLLGGGQDARALERELEAACRAGASGIIVGRTVWDAALVEDARQSTRAIEAVSRPILARIRSVVEATARPLPQPTA